MRRIMDMRDNQTLVPPFEQRQPIGMGAPSEEPIKIEVSLDNQKSKGILHQTKAPDNSLSTTLRSIRHRGNGQKNTALWQRLVVKEK